MVLRVAVVGANGRMGSLVRELIGNSDEFELGAAIGSADALDGIRGADLVVDLTRFDVSERVVELCLAERIPALVGTSGWSAERLATLEARLRETPEIGVIVVPNFSIGSVLATRFAALAAPWFDSIEIVEAHHAEKVDSPSGTAVRTAELMAAARAELGPVAAPHADQRARGQQVASIPVHSIRLAGITAKQDVLFGAPGETLEIVHTTGSNAAYEAGILLALRALPGVRGLVVGLDPLLPAR